MILLPTRAANIPLIRIVLAPSTIGTGGTGGIGFSFTRSDSDPQRAVRDLGEAIEALSADGEIGAALAEATERLKAGEEQAFEEQRRLHSAREKVKERLASLTGTD